MKAPPIRDIRNRVTDLGRSLSNSWDAVQATALPDQKLALGISRRFEKGSFIAGNVTSLTYSYSNTFREAVNNSSIYNYAYDTPGILDEYIDRQYRTSACVGLMHNQTLYPYQGLKLEFRNLSPALPGQGYQSERDATGTTTVGLSDQVR